MRNSERDSLHCPKQVRVPSFAQVLFAGADGATLLLRMAHCQSLCSHQYRADHETASNSKDARVYLVLE